MIMFSVAWRRLETIQKEKAFEIMILECVCSALRSRYATPF